MFNGRSLFVLAMLNEKKRRKKSTNKQEDEEEEKLKAKHETYSKILVNVQFHFSFKNILCFKYMFCFVLCVRVFFLFTDGLGEIECISLLLELLSNETNVTSACVWVWVRVQIENLNSC